MDNKKTPIERREKRVRGKIVGTESTPRLSVYRSSQYIYAQLIDDEKGKTLLGVSERHLEETTGNKTDKARHLGVYLGKKAVEKKIKRAIFDRGSYGYHGRVQAFAEGAREGGLEF